MSDSQYGSIKKGAGGGGGGEEEEEDEDDDVEVGTFTPRKQRRILYASCIGDEGVQWEESKINPKDKPKRFMLIAEIMKRDPTKKPNHWSWQQAATWLHQHPKVRAFYF